MERKNEKLIAAFARTLKDHRKAAGLSQEELAFRTDLSTSYISLLETKNRQLTLTVIAALAEELDVTLTELMKRTETALAKKL